MVRSHLFQRVRYEFERAFGRDVRPAIAVAPGRVNLIGEHTDYNEGFVLPAAIDKHVAVAFAPRADRILRAYSAEFDHAREMSLDSLADRVATEPDKRSGRGGWFDYVAGVAWAMLAAGRPLVGADLAIAGDLPVGAGLSSSAALEIAVARALASVAGLEWDPRVAAVQAQRAEHEFAGVACGIMDQLSVAAAREGCALLIDCRSMETTDVPIPEEARILVFDSGVRRELASSAYNARRASCERVVRLIQSLEPGVSALRDVNPALLDRLAQTEREKEAGTFSGKVPASFSLDPVDLRRARHVIAENARPAALADAFRSDDLVRAGRLMRDSHESLRDLYEVSSPELDALVELASSQPGCHGARLTGAGFGGCVIAVVEAGSVERVMSSVETGYQERMGRPTTAFVIRASQGARILDEGQHTAGNS
jgi:galactokinase